MHHAALLPLRLGIRLYARWLNLAYYCCTFVALNSATHSAEEYDSLDGEAPTATGGPRISAETAAFLKQLEAAERRVARMKLVDKSASSAAAVTSHDTSAGT
jgi:hypothetical protein